MTLGSLDFRVLFGKQKNKASSDQCSWEESRIKKEVRRFKWFDFGVFREPMDKVW